MKLLSKGKKKVIFMKTKSKVINNYNGTATINEKRKKKEKN